MSETTSDQPSVPVTEIFHSLQGESTWAGLPCTFVRLTGCPLRCVWCDTSYSFHGGERRTLADIISRVREIGTELVEVTGGEPLAHPHAFLLVEQLADAGHTVLVETSGAVDVAPLDPRAHKIMDLKCPGSGESHRNLWTNLDHVGPGDEIKFVVKDREDWDWTARTIREYGLDEMVESGRLGALLVSPVWGEIEPEALADWTTSSGLPVRFQMQLHKLIWGADRKGV